MLLQTHTRCLLLACLFGMAASEAGTDERDAPQRGEFACGPSALSMAARLLGKSVNADELSRAMRGNLTGTCSLRDLQRAAEELGFVTRPVKLESAEASLLKLPLIVALGRDSKEVAPKHFVVVYGKAGSSPQLLDYPKPPRFVTAESLGRSWGRYGLYLAASDESLASMAPIPGHAANLRALVGGILVAAGVAWAAIHWRRTRAADPS